ncbi:c-type cytochrome biogenesis protein CcsB [Alcaligenes pakistanensis]|uniref:C-type cytochrome biogenesis protein CcsB n=1 Tax=Alcaligenes pakistanensis TaxID=1482717 RepID=A0A8H9IKG8_9BURK|nr:c-type cytochrome biogenesis protein CcsB [Alcaligenes pakistanensis]MBP6621553.1 c-type cytochrome biogenesis protein CcsB [Alcaligenes sp.]GHC51959.1 c-type cytochrome biogenesis protein CcsB [Alcaligenes pakistanensis]HCA18085.1 c-type cytochrome biogenesis protein CcsB [Alcaligenes faecalis]
MAQTLSSATPTMWQDNIASSGDRRGIRGRPDWTDVLYLVVLALGAAYALNAYSTSMDYYEKIILVAFVPFIAWLGWLWRPLRTLLVAAGLTALLAIWLYSTGDGLSTGDIEKADSVFLLKYLFSSQSAILWMCALFILATVMYWAGFFSDTAAWMGSGLTWAAVYAGTTGLLVRWREGHLLGPDIGHIPVSNLYEVFVLLALITALFYLYYERRYSTRALGGFVLLAISSLVVFLLWYSFTRDAHQIQPLVPALKSWWMKLHVPANFIGYGTFSLAAMVGFAYLVKENGETRSRAKLIPVFLLGAILCAEPMIFGSRELSPTWMLYFGIGSVMVGTILYFRGPISRKLPSLEVLDDIMYRAIAVGFAFFTVATVLGALWAADAWGTYWQWDPKETWALIVWLNYAAWLHLRLLKGLRGTMAAYWALGGLLITSFAFLGVNMFLSGLHSYGEL